ncbi:MAG: hypothetical protein BAJALOKI2v1_230052 [Promethearchaeota archaeon]|nr:MAG: hypothetical protein BAJALOKI2v1_230052 [Candidatus Lokiarchaeota archaeon]
MMRSIYILDACGLFAFFQLASPNSIKYLNKLNISSKLQRVFYKMLIEEIEIVIPVPALSEFMYKLYKNKKMKKYNEFIKQLEKRDNFYFIGWDFQVLKSMADYLLSYSNKIDKYTEKTKEGIELFDLCIYHIGKLNNIKIIISKDKIFDELYNLKRVW